MKTETIKTVRVKNLEKGMKILNVGVVKEVEEYKNVVVVHLVESVLKLDAPNVVYKHSDYLHVSVDE